MSKKKTEWVDVQSPAELKAGDWVRFRHLLIPGESSRCEGEVRVMMTTGRWVGGTSLSNHSITFRLNNSEFSPVVSGVQVRRKVKPLKPGYYLEYNDFGAQVFWVPDDPKESPSVDPIDLQRDASRDELAELRDSLKHGRAVRLAVSDE